MGKSKSSQILEMLSKEECSFASPLPHPGKSVFRANFGQPALNSESHLSCGSVTVTCLVGIHKPYKWYPDTTYRAPHSTVEIAELGAKLKDLRGRKKI